MTTSVDRPSMNPDNPSNAAPRSVLLAMNQSAADLMQQVAVAGRAVSQQIEDSEDK